MCFYLPGHHGFSFFSLRCLFCYFCHTALWVQQATGVSHRWYVACDYPSILDHPSLPPSPPPPPPPPLPCFVSGYLALLRYSHPSRLVSLAAVLLAIWMICPTYLPTLLLPPPPPRRIVVATRWHSHLMRCLFLQLLLKSRGRSLAR
ncbi:hypothetical protein IWX90DRAFT_47333 [Phyllosticta citrichinensis]|uniref:Uncharacterized protein n=1 Tax=Phyllosticta citrichinensis TaxID=1130410 RepID=A0ABR1XI19_9PEZI